MLGCEYTWLDIRLEHLVGDRKDFTSIYITIDGGNWILDLRIWILD
ncbi:MAG: hypothetical protein V7L14_03660 [Nostoc sp.]|nr:hypothetical protein [Nostoc sp. NOS(2021)]MBN3898405.1 hypothetical protein [Nostoc sp. NOS(2021)]